MRLSATVLLCALAATPILGQARATTPADAAILAVVKAFCVADDAGRQLTGEGRREIAAMFTAPGPADFRHALIVDDFGYSNPYEVSAGRAKVQAIYTTVARLDTVTAVVNEEDYRAIKFLREMRLVAPEGGGPWRFEGPPLEPHISVSAALRHVRALRDNTSDATIRATAGRTVRFLERHGHWRTGKRSP